MRTVFGMLLIAMFAGVMVSFLVTFYYQAIVMWKVTTGGQKEVTSGKKSYRPFENLFSFFAGKLYPELRLKWLKSWMWSLVSFFSLFFTLVVSDNLGWL